MATEEDRQRLCEVEEVGGGEGGLRAAPEGLQSTA